MEKMLNDADRVIGDGDHGSAMVRGFNSVIKKLENEEFSNLSSLFVSVGNEFIASIGGSSGIIFGTLFRSGGKVLNDDIEFNSKNFTSFLEAAYEAVRLRGKAHVGDKTLLDVLYPAMETARENKNLLFSEFIQKVVISADEGLKNTKNLEAKTGRSKDFGGNSIGFSDPGSITLYTIISEFNQFSNV
jgi:dihydroxyacetone kinase-like protein